MPGGCWRGLQPRRAGELTVCPVDRHADRVSASSWLHTTACPGFVSPVTRCARLRPRACRHPMAKLSIQRVEDCCGGYQGCRGVFPLQERIWRLLPAGCRLRASSGSRKRRKDSQLGGRLLCRTGTTTDGLGRRIDSLLPGTGLPKSP